MPQKICQTSAFKAKVFKAYFILTLPEVVDQAFRTQTQNQGTKTEA